MPDAARTVSGIPRAHPGGRVIPRFWHRLNRFRHFCGGSLALASLDRACRNPVPTFPQRSPPWLLTAAACGGLRSTPDCRPRRALLHLSYSYASPCGPALLVTQDHCGSRGLVRPCTGVPDYFAPLFRFVGEESSKFGRGASKRSAAQIGKSILHLRIGKAEVYLCVELVDDFSRRILRRTDAEPYARVVTGQEFGHTLNIGQKLRARRSGDRESAQRSSSNVLDRCRNAAKHHFHLATDEISQCRGLTAIRYVDHADACHHLEQLARHVERAAIAGRSHANFVRISFRVGDKFRNAVCLKCRVYLHHERPAEKAGNRASGLESN